MSIKKILAVIVICANALIFAQDSNTVEKQVPIKITRSQIIILNGESLSFNRMSYAQRYIGMLESGNQHDKLFAATVLRRFHSEKVIDSLFAAINKETDENLLRAMCNTIYDQFFEQIPNFDPETEDISKLKEQIVRFHENFNRETYQKFFIENYDRLSSSAEGGNIFVNGICESNDSGLLPVLIHVYEKSKNTGIKEIAQNAILECSGYDLTASKLNQVQVDILQTNLMTAEQISKRYMLFLKKNGYDKDDIKLLSASILLFEKSESKEPARIIAFRLATKD
jgi:hypothetical protein